MALRDQPYLPLYVNDFLSDEKLMLCSAEATGVYIRLLCLMHKSEEYGQILLKQNFKQNDKQISNFACLLSRQMPFEFEVIERALTELSDFGVITITDDTLFQKRMVKDGELSEKRANAGRKGVSAKAEKVFAEAKRAKSDTSKTQANSENEIENENINETENNNKVSEKKTSKKKDKAPKEDVFKAFAENDEKLLSKLRDFEDHRKKLGDAFKSPYARTLFVNKLKRMAGDDHSRMMYLIDYAIERGWKSVYEPKEFTRYNREPENSNIFREMLEEEQRKKGGGAGDP